MPHAHHFKRRTNALGLFGGGHATHLQPKRNIVEHAQVWPQRITLKYHSGISLFWRRVRDIAVAKENFPAGGFLKARNHAKQCCLAATRRPQHEM